MYLQYFSGEYTFLKPISGSIYGGRPQSVNQMHLQYFLWETYWCQSDTEATFMAAKCSHES